MLMFDIFKQNVKVLPLRAVQCNSESLPLDWRHQLQKKKKLKNGEKYLQD